MFNKKNLSTCVAALFISLGIYAQTSQTYTTTSGLFRTDVDNFMNVTAWEAVDFSQTEKNTLIFADLNSSSISFGYAKEFSSLYFGTYIGGALPRFTEASYATTDYQVNVSPRKNFRVHMLKNTVKRLFLNWLGHLQSSMEKALTSDLCIFMCSSIKHTQRL